MRDKQRGKEVFTYLHTYVLLRNKIAGPMHVVVYTYGIHPSPFPWRRDLHGIA